MRRDTPAPIPPSRRPGRGALPLSADASPTGSFRAWFTAAYLAFVVYGSLVPLQFVPIAWDEAVRRFQAIAFLQLGIASRADWVANLLLFIPLTFVGLSAWCDRCARLWSWWRAALVLMASVGLAVGLEFTQLYFPARTVSQNDIAAEALGGVVGIVAFRLWGARFRATIDAWWGMESGKGRWVWITHAYLLGLFVYNVLPLDLVISPVELYHKYREGRVLLIPLADLHGTWLEVAWELMSDVVLWLPVGVLWRLRGAPVARAVLQGLLAAAVIELLQLFVYTRVTATTDVLMGALGCGVVALATRSLAADGMPGDAVTRTSRPGLRWGWWAWSAWAVLTLLAFWYPFDPVTSGHELRQRLDDLWRPPLQTYYMVSEYRAATEVLRKLLMLLPGGLLWAVAMRQVVDQDRRRWLRRMGLAMAAVMGVTIEIGQLGLVGKVADFTDAVLETIGGVMGLILGERLFGRTPPGVDSRRPAALRKVGSLPTAPSAASARRSVPRAAPKSLRRDVVIETGMNALLALALVGLSRSPALPYNVRELFPAGVAGLVASACLVLLLWGLLAWPVHALLWWRNRPDMAVRVIPSLIGASLLAAVAATFGLPPESVDDVVGSPILKWPWVLETLGRFTALYGAVALAAAGGAWIAAHIGSRLMRGLVGVWTVTCMLLVGPLHLVIVTFAATDNLTELMRNGGGVTASVSLFAGAVSLFAAGSALSAALCMRVWRRRLRLLMVFALCWGLAGLLLWWGSESMLIKYDRAFSAAQFLLSSDREHYATGAPLIFRFLMACTGLFAITAWMQWPSWHRLASELHEVPSVHAGLR